MGEPIEGEDEIALQGLLGHRQADIAESLDLKSTSKFQDNNESFDKEFGSGDPDFDEAEKMAYNLSNKEERKSSPPASPNRQSLHDKRRAQWGNGDSFGGRYDHEEQKQKIDEIQDFVAKSKEEREIELK